MADETIILVTGANAGLGFAICRRLIDEFLHTRPSTASLKLILTTRSKAKAEDAIGRLQAHLRSLQKRSGPQEQPFDHRIHLTYELLDLLSLHSVKLAASLLQRHGRLDAIILNAGISGGTTVNWWKMFLQFLRDGYKAMVWTEFKISPPGRLAPQQTRDAQETLLGEVFTANTFGHYILAHDLLPLLSRSAHGRVIWLSTIEATGSAFDIHDIQSLSSTRAYEGSKRVADVLALTSRLPSTSPWTQSYFADTVPVGKVGADMDSGGGRPKIYTAHPGVCATNIVPQPLLVQYLQVLSFLLFRLLGSLWTTVYAYTGATAPVWLALAEEEMLMQMERKEGQGKWGSAVDAWGEERVERTEVEGWGFGGMVGDVLEGGNDRRRGRRPGAKDLTREDREEFEGLGREIWSQMEGLRIDWEERLARDRDS